MEGQTPSSAPRSDRSARVVLSMCTVHDHRPDASDTPLDLTRPVLPFTVTYLTS
jgi:hypothetical protein